MFQIRAGGCNVDVAAADVSVEGRVRSHYQDQVRRTVGCGSDPGLQAPGGRRGVQGGALRLAAHGLPQVHAPGHRGDMVRCEDSRQIRPCLPPDVTRYSQRDSGSEKDAQR